MKNAEKRINVREFCSKCQKPIDFKWWFKSNPNEGWCQDCDEKTCFSNKIWDEAKFGSAWDEKISGYIQVHKVPNDCGFNKCECSEEVKKASRSDKEVSIKNEVKEPKLAKPSYLGLLIVLGVVAVILGAAWWFSNKVVGNNNKEIEDND